MSPKIHPKWKYFAHAITSEFPIALPGLSSLLTDQSNLSSEERCLSSHTSAQELSSCHFVELPPPEDKIIYFFVSFLGLFNVTCKKVKKKIKTVLKFRLTGVQLLASPAYLMPQRMSASIESSWDIYDLACVCMPGPCMSFLRL